MAKLFRGKVEFQWSVTRGRDREWSGAVSEAAAAKNVVFSANEPAMAAGNLYRAAATTINNVLVLGANAK